MKKLLDWYKLDNSARLYPVLITKNSQSLFRVSAILNEEVDSERLHSALSQIMPRFPSFSVRLRNGFFWYYFEENNRPVKIFRDDGIMLKPIDLSETNHYWFRVSYFSRTVNLDMFHAISDGNGATEFLKALICRYLTLGGAVLGNDNVIDVNMSPTESEIEDSFQKYYKETKLKDIDLKKMTGSAPLLIKGSVLRGEGYGSVLGTVSVAALKEKAKEMGTGINILIAALIVASIAKTSVSKGKQKPIVMMVPMNLRKIFGGNTLRNFVLFSRICVTPSADKTLADYISECSAQLKEDLKKENAQLQLNTAVKGLKAAVFKFMPLPLKYFSIKIGKLFLRSRQTVIFSNLGKVEVPENMQIDRFTFNVNVGRYSPVNIGAVAYGDKLVISFTRDIIETNIEREFFTSLVKMGVEVTVASNFREEQNVL